MWFRNRKRIKHLELHTDYLETIIKIRDEQIKRGETIINRLLNEKKKAKKI